MITEKPKTITGISLTPRIICRLLLNRLLLTPIYRFIWGSQPVNSCRAVSKPNGGWEKTALYTTRQVRVPKPLIPQVHTPSDRYQDDMIASGAAQEPSSLMHINEIQQLKSEVEKWHRERLVLDTEVSLLRARNEILNHQKAELEEKLKAHSQFQGNWNQAVAILQEALKLKGNAGKVIKERIKEALQVLESV